MISSITSKGLAIPSAQKASQMRSTCDFSSPVIIRARCFHPLQILYRRAAGAEANKIVRTLGESVMKPMQYSARLEPTPYMLTMNPKA